jgi:hypothetical protein
VKSARYTPADREAFVAAANDVAERLRSGQRNEPARLPPLRNIERWWAPAELAFVARLRAGVETHGDRPVRDLLDVAFCRTMIALSNAAFNHQSMSFKDAPSRQLALLPETTATPDATQRGLEQFLSDTRVVAEALEDNPGGSVRIEQVDARGLATLAEGDTGFDMLVTSPPYPNRMSYIRELRPYMYWLGFLRDGKQAGELDWEAIGGTWGVATSRLSSWEPAEAFVPDYLAPILDAIRGEHPKNGALMARYVHKYFADMFVHFCAAAARVRRGGSAHYIVGNSAFYGHLVPAERLYCDQLLAAGFRRAGYRALRKRNSKKELIEFHVIAER